jgi:hypothetical protein
MIIIATMPKTMVTDLIQNNQKTIGRISVQKESGIFVRSVPNGRPLSAHTARALLQTNVLHRMHGHHQERQQ